MLTVLQHVVAVLGLNHLDTKIKERLNTIGLKPVHNEQIQVWNANNVIGASPCPLDERLFVLFVPIHQSQMLSCSSHKPSTVGIGHL